MSIPPNLPESLACVLPSDLEQNRANYPELIAKAPSADHIEWAKQRLLSVPLLHVTSTENNRLIRQAGLLPSSVLGHEGTVNSHTLDRSLGLDRAIFFSHGDMRQTRGLWVMAQASMLLDENVIVTPTDINATAWSQDVAYHELPEQKRMAVDSEYLGKMLTGTDWLHVIAVRLAKMGRIRRSEIGLPAALCGEVKVFRHILPSELELVADDESKKLILSGRY